MRHATQSDTESAANGWFARPRTILALFGLLLLLVPVMLHLRAGIGVETPTDALFDGYTSDQLYALLDAEGTDGRFSHLLFEVADLVLIPVYVVLYVAGITHGFRRLLGRRSPIVLVLALVPAIAGAVDYAEDAGLVALLLSYPDTLPSLADLTGLLTAAKWVLVGASLLLTIVALLGSGFRAVYSRFARRSPTTIDASYVRVEPAPASVRRETVATDAAGPDVQTSTEDDFFNARTVKLDRSPELMAALRDVRTGQAQAAPPPDEATDAPTMTFAWGPELLAALRDVKGNQRGASSRLAPLSRARERGQG